MSLLAESLVEEWLNRDGYFTIRGARYGVSELDLLAVRHTQAGPEARHIEVQVSTHPVAYITPMTDGDAKKVGKARTSAWKRPPAILKAAVTAWVEKKFHSPGKVKARNKAGPGLMWSLEFVHGNVRHEDELPLIKASGIKTIEFHVILASLCNDKALTHKGGAGTDIAEMVGYYVKHMGMHT